MNGITFVYLYFGNNSAYLRTYFYKLASTQCAVYPDFKVLFVGSTVIVLYIAVPSLRWDSLHAESIDNTAIAIINCFIFTVLCDDYLICD